MVCDECVRLWTGQPSKPRKRSVIGAEPAVGEENGLVTAELLQLLEDNVTGNERPDFNLLVIVVRK